MDELIMACRMLIRYIMIREIADADTPSEVVYAESVIRKCQGEVDEDQ